ncbi:hypothetical protein ACWD33_20975 [Streptomyces xiamenensis]
MTSTATTTTQPVLVLGQHLDLWSWAAIAVIAAANTVTAGAER